MIFLTRLSGRTSDNQKSDFTKYSIFSPNGESGKLQIFTRPNQILPDQSVTWHNSMWLISYFNTHFNIWSSIPAMVFRLLFSVLSIQITERGSNFNDMQHRFTLANWGIEKFLERENEKNGHSNSSAIYPSLHNRYIACVYPKYCDSKGGDFRRRTFSF